MPDPVRTCPSPHIVEAEFVRLRQYHGEDRKKARRRVSSHGSDTTFDVPLLPPPMAATADEGHASAVTCSCSSTPNRSGCGRERLRPLCLSATQRPRVVYRCAEAAGTTKDTGRHAHRSRACVRVRTQWRCFQRAASTQVRVACIVFMLSRVIGRRYVT
jgi:hypothetical protein